MVLPWLVQVETVGGALVATARHGTQPECMAWIDGYLDELLWGCTEQHCRRVAARIGKAISTAFRAFPSAMM
jgi:hypothetical protein